MKRLLLSMVLSLGLAGTAGAYTITFDIDDSSSPFRFATLISSPFNLESNKNGNMTTAVFTPGDISGDLLTHIVTTNGLEPQDGKDREFFFHGADLYASADTNVQIIGREGSDDASQIAFDITLHFTHNGTFKHFDFDKDPMFNNLFAKDGETLIPKAVIGALLFRVEQGKI